MDRGRYPVGCPVCQLETLKPAVSARRSSFVPLIESNRRRENEREAQLEKEVQGINLLALYLTHFQVGKRTESRADICIAGEAYRQTVQGPGRNVTCSSIGRSHLQQCRVMSVHLGEAVHGGKNKKYSKKYIINILYIYINIIYLIFYKL